MSRGKIAFEQGPCGIVSLERYTATHVFALAVSSRAVCAAAALALIFGESGLLENEPTAPAEQAHTTQRQ